MKGAWVSVPCPHQTGMEQGPRFQRKFLSQREAGLLAQQSEVGPSVSAI